MTAICSVSTSRSTPATGDAALLQRAHQFVDEGVAPAHQHQDVAGADHGSIVRAQLLAAPDQVGDEGGDAARQPLPRRVAGGAAPAAAPRAPAPRLPPAPPAARARPAPPGRRRDGRDAPATRRRRQRPSRAARANTASTASSTGCVERKEMFERHGSQRPAWPRGCAGRNASRIVANSRGIGALEAEDRLLLVADREDACAAAALAPSPAKNSSVERRDDLPLLGAGVLRLVDQDVVEAAVELVEHPGRHARAGSAARRVPRIRSS